MKIRGSWALAVSLTCAGPVFAGIVDTPLPAAFKQVLYSVPGVINSGALGTYISCTSVAAAPITVEVDFFSNTGAVASPAVPTPVAPGASVMFTNLGPTFSLVPDVILPGPPVTKGSARILSTSKSLLCTAFVADISGVPSPASGWQLPIIAKTKQKAAN